MALKCSECGKVVQKGFNFCPNCGIQIKKRSTKKYLFIVLLILVVVATVVGGVILLKPRDDNARLLVLAKLGLKKIDVEKELGKDYELDEENHIIYNKVEIVPGVFGRMKFVSGGEYIYYWYFYYYETSEEQKKFTEKILENTFKYSKVDDTLAFFRGLDESVTGTALSSQISCHFHDFKE